MREQTNAQYHFVNTPPPPPKIWEQTTQCKRLEPWKTKNFMKWRKCWSATLHKSDGKQPYTSISLCISVGRSYLVLSWKILPYIMLERNLILFWKVLPCLFLESVTFHNTKSCQLSIEYLKQYQRSSLKLYQRPEWPRIAVWAGVHKDYVGKIMRIVQVKLWKSFRSGYKNCGDQVMKIVQISPWKLYR